MTVATIVFRRVLRAKRTWALALLPALGIVVGYMMLTNATDEKAAYAGYLSGLLFPLIVALVSWVVAASAVTDERDELTILYLAQTPVARLRTAVETWLATWAASLILVALPVLMAALLARNADLAASSVLDVVVASVLASAAYCGLGVLVGFFTKRAAIWGLVYVLLWESIMSGFAAGARNLSISQHARAIAARGVDPWTRHEIDPPSTSAGVALVVLVAIVGVSLLLEGRRFSRINLP